MTRRSDLVLGLAVSAGLHGVLLAALGRIPSPVTAGDGGERPPLEVVALSPEEVRDLLDPAPLPRMLEVAEAPRVHDRAPAPWPRAAAHLPATSPLDSPSTRSLSTPASPPARPRVEVPALPELWVTADPAPVPEVAASVDPSDPVAVATESTGAEPEGVPPPAGALVRARVAPRYPQRASDRGVEGVATIGMRVADDGTVERAWVLKTSGSRLLDRAAINALSRWRFDMAAVRARGAGRVFSEDVRFSLRSRRP